MALDMEREREYTRTLTDGMDISGLMLVLKSEDGFCTTYKAGDMDADEAKRIIRMVDSGLSFIG